MSLMKIPDDRLEKTRHVLQQVICEREGLWGAYNDEVTISRDDQDYEDAGSVRTLLDVLRWLRDQGSQTYLSYYVSCLDPLAQFDVEQFPDEGKAEEAFREYLTKTYSIDPSEFPEL